jgi:hypothetical protein
MSSDFRNKPLNIEVITYTWLDTMASLVYYYYYYRTIILYYLILYYSLHVHYPILWERRLSYRLYMTVLNQISWSLILVLNTTWPWPSVSSDRWLCTLTISCCALSLCPSVGTISLRVVYMTYTTSAMYRAHLHVHVCQLCELWLCTRCAQSADSDFQLDLSKSTNVSGFKHMTWTIP